jgi:hypothetical protein
MLIAAIGGVVWLRWGEVTCVRGPQTLPWLRDMQAQTSCGGRNVPGDAGAVIPARSAS